VSKEHSELSEPCVGTFGDSTSSVMSESLAVVMTAALAVAVVRDNEIDAVLCDSLLPRVGFHRPGSAIMCLFFFRGQPLERGTLALGALGFRRYTFFPEWNSQWETATVDQYDPLDALAPLALPKAESPSWAGAKQLSRNGSSHCRGSPPSSPLRAMFALC
jgi:hypothetical protein